MMQKPLESITWAADVPAVGMDRFWLRSPKFWQALVFLGADLLVLVLTHMLAIRLVQHFLALPMSALNPAEYHRYYVPFFAVLLYLAGGYSNQELRRPERELAVCCKAVSLGFLGLVLFNFVVFRSQPISRYLVGSWFLLAGASLILVRFSLRAVYARLWKAGVGRRKAVWVGSPAELEGFREQLATQRHDGFELLGIIPFPFFGISTSATGELPMLENLEHLESAVRHSGADLLLLSTSTFSGDGQSLERIMRSAKELGIELELYSSVLANSDLNFECDEFSGCFRFFARPKWSLRLQHALKRGLDVATGVAGSLVTLLLTPILGMVIKLQDGGPVFYRSAYLGQDGRERFYWKFRTMCVDADALLHNDSKLQLHFQTKHKLAEDPRVTRFGRFLRRSSLDEIPQFLDILVGNLSLVGPRTIRKEESFHYGALLPKLLSFKPGLTGFWQTMGRQTTTYEERVRMDMFYINHWSIWLDLVIVVKTFWKVLKAEGAY
jgi:exopolysaccharide biosynthesis polyprenyl glycosylphosphotransferase